MRSIKHMPRPKDLSDEAKSKIQELFDKDLCQVNFQQEQLDLIDGEKNIYISIPFAAIGKMIALMHYHGVTVKKK